MSGVRPRPWITRIDPYVPGTPAPNGDGSLASNESVAGPSGTVVEAVTQVLGGIHRYPDPLGGKLRRALATLHDVDPEQILLGNGSDELVYLLVLAFVGYGGRVVCASPAYRIDEVSAAVVGAEVVRVPLVSWRHDLAAMASVQAHVAFVVNPHNPTGTACSLAEITRFVQTARAGLTVIDEAYVDFSDVPDATSAVPLARQGDAVVLRTFSKIFGLAGVRIGYLIGSREVVATLRKVRAPFSVSSLAQAAALAALADRAHYDRVRSETMRRREDLVRLLAAHGLESIPSQANFVLVPCDDEEELTAHLAGFGISVRPGSALGLRGTVRISVPSAAGLRLLAGALATARPGLSARR